MPSNEENIVSDIKKKFSSLSEKIRIQRERRIWIEVGYPEFSGLLDYLIGTQGFARFCTVTGLDENENLSFIYHIARQDGVVANVKTSVPKNNPTIKTVTGHFPSALVPEKELEDLFGAKVEGLKPGFRYPLPDDWPEGEYPLRKDWKGGKDK